VREKMTENELEKQLLTKLGAKKEFQFGEDVAVFKVSNKIFALYSIEDGKIRLNLKSKPEDAVGYREIYNCVIPGYHMNKKHWNTVIFDGEMSDEVLSQMIDESYQLIVSKLTKKEKELLQKLA
jgi:predicted DNA-binding protein (MmcQ/YjbR family)